MLQKPCRSLLNAMVVLAMVLASISPLPISADAAPSSSSSPYATDHHTKASPAFARATKELTLQDVSVSPSADDQLQAALSNELVSIPDALEVSNDLSLDEWGTDDGSSAGWLFSRRYQGAISLPYDQVVTGTIAIAGQVVTYTFSAGAGYRVTAALQEQTSGSVILRLYAPGGGLLGSCTANSFCQLDNQTLSAAGAYTATVAGSGSATGNYTLVLNRLDGDEQPIAYGETVTGTISPIGDVDYYTFAASPGQSIYFDAQSSSVYYQYLDWRLEDEQGNVIFATSSFVDQHYILSAGGTYTLAVDGEGDIVSTYRFLISDATPEVFNVSIGDVISDGVPEPGAGNIEVPGAEDIYIFPGEAGQHITVFLDNQVGYPNAFSVRLSKPDGTDWYCGFTYSDCLLDNYTLPATAIYTITVDGEGADTGDYVLTLNSSTSTFLPLDTPREIAVAPMMSLLFQLDVPSGTTNLFIALQKYGSWNGLLTLTDGSGQELASASGGDDHILHLPSPAAGTYFVRVSGSGTGRLAALTALPELSLGQWKVGSILRQWGSAWYQINVPAGQTSLYVYVETLGIRSQLKVYRGVFGNAPVWSASGATMNLQIPSPQAGVYYVHLADSAWVQGGSQVRDHMIKADVVPIEPPPCTTPTVTDMTPTTGGTAGPVTVRINGQCLDPDSTVCLTRQGYNNVCAPTVTGSEDGRSLAATFDLSAAAPGGWNLVVTNSYSQSVTAPVSFTVESGGETNLWVDIVGRDQIRVGRTSTFIVQYGNKGKIDARNVYIILGVPASLACDVDIPGFFIESEPWLGDSSDPSALYITTVYVMSIPSDVQGEFTMYLRSQAVASSLPLYANITLNPRPYFQDIPDNPLTFLGVSSEAFFGTEMTTLPSNIISTSDPEPDCTSAPPAGYVLIFGNYGPFKNHVAKSIGNGQFIEMVPGGINFGQISQFVSGDQCVTSGNGTIYYGAFKPPWWGPDDEARVKIAAEKIKKLKEQDKMQDAYINNSCNSEFYPLTSDGPVIKTDCIGFVEFLNPQFGDWTLKTGQMITPWDWLGPYYREKAINASPEAEWSSEDVSKGQQCFDRYNNLVRNSTLDSIMSVSPEDKYGPSGYDTLGTPTAQLKRWIPASQPLGYRIDFWNKETAPAATGDIVITDTLDTDLDWSTFQFTEIGFLDWRVPLEPCQYFNVDVDNVRIDFSRYYAGAPVVTMSVNVEGIFDPATGQITWTFHTFDPATGEPPEEPVAGFLPPITDSGWEIGWVAFSVSPKSGLASGTTVANQAFVQFDTNPFNPAPPAGPFVNTLDAAAPTSAVQPPSASQQCAWFPVTWAGSDEQNGSGLRGFDVYVDDLGDAAPAFLWLANTTNTSATFKGLPGHRYGFYTRAHDNAGNIEISPLGYDVEVIAGPYCIYVPLVLKGKR